MKPLLKPLKDLLYNTDMTFEEVRAFERAISQLPLEHQVALYRLFNYDRSLIYPTYINYLAKLNAKETGIGWDEAVQQEIKFLESYIEGKRVGDEIK